MGAEVSGGGSLREQGSFRMLPACLISRAVETAPQACASQSYPMHGFGVKFDSVLTQNDRETDAMATSNQFFVSATAPRSRSADNVETKHAQSGE